METFGQPLWEIENRFTASEIVMMGWRSQEQVYQMRQRMNRPTTVGPALVTDEGKKRKVYADGNVPEGVPDHMYNEDGEIDLSRATFKEALTYMNAIGIKLPPPMGKRASTVIRDVDKGPTMDDIFGPGE